MAGKVKIIGGGIAGLSAGCYLQLNGFDTEIFEMHTLPGGLCTAWQRQGYIFNGSLHWLVGSAPGNPFHRFWRELINLDEIRFLHPDRYFRIEDRDGRTLDFFSDIKRLEAELLSKAPEDEAEIRTFIRAIRKLLRFRLEVDKAPELQSYVDRAAFIIHALPCLGVLRKYVRLTHEAYSRQFRNPLLARAVRELFVPEVSVIFSMFTLAWMHQKCAGYPVGGSGRFSRRIEERYLGLGGKIHYDSRVQQITTRNGKATGIVLADGTNHHADIVISAADGHDTIWNLLGGRFADDATSRLYETHATFSSLIQVSLGVRRSFDGAVGALRLLLDDFLQVDPATRTDLLSCTLYHFDPTLAPPGSTPIVVLIPTNNHRYWQDLRAADSCRYAAEKDRIAQAVIAVLEKRFGSIQSCLEVVDVATPATYHRYTNNWRGSFEGWLLTPQTGFRPLSKTLPGLSNFYMIGQWVQPGGGVPAALLSARNVTQMICRQEKRAFRTTV